MVILDHESASMQSIDEKSQPTNYFTYFLSRIHREEDFHFILSGLIKLLNNPLMQVQTTKCLVFVVSRPPSPAFPTPLTPS